MTKKRDDFLIMDDETLSANTEIAFFKGSGNGGQKRNKTSSAVRVTLTQYGIAASDCTERSQHRNRANALRKLRIALALQERELPAVPPENSVCGIAKAEYPLHLAHLLDVLEEASYDLKSTALRLNVTFSALLKQCHAFPALWQKVQKERSLRHLPELLSPK